MEPTSSHSVRKELSEEEQIRFSPLPVQQRTASLKKEEKGRVFFPPFRRRMERGENLLSAYRARQRWGRKREMLFPPPPVARRREEEGCLPLSPRIRPNKEMKKQLSH